MKDLLWRLALVAVWIGVFAVGAQLLTPVFGRMCEDCIGSRPGYYGEGGYVVDWESVVVASGLNATLVTGLLVFGSRAFRRRSGSVQAA